MDKKKWKLAVYTNRYYYLSLVRMYAIKKYPNQQKCRENVFEINVN